MTIKRATQTLYISPVLAGLALFFVAALFTASNALGGSLLLLATAVGVLLAIRARPANRLDGPDGPRGGLGVPAKPRDPDPSREAACAAAIPDER